MRLRFLLLPLVSSLFGSMGCPDDVRSLSELETVLVVRPTRVDLDPLWGGVPHTVTLVVENRGRAPLGNVQMSIDERSGPGDFEVHVSGDALPPGGSLEVQLTALGLVDGVGALTAMLTVRADDAEAHVPLSANVRPQPSCDDDNPCTRDRFDPQRGTCVREPLPNLASCDDGNACTDGDRCIEAACVGEPVTCDDEVGCTVDRCDPAVGCVFEPAHNRCDDEDPCTDDVCSQEAGCANPPKPTGSVCYQNGCAEIGFCVAGSCQHRDVPDGIPCEDGDVCTEGDTCQAGVCTSGEVAAFGASGPTLVDPGNVLVSQCAGPAADLSSCSTGVAGASVEEVLAVIERDGIAEVVWRSPFVDGLGQACAPNDSLYLSAGFFGDLDAGPTRGEGSQPIPDVCGAGVYWSRAPVGSTGSASTVQLSLARGPVAAAFGPARSYSPLDVVLVHAGPEGASVWLERLRHDGSHIQWPMEAAWLADLGGDRLRQLAIARVAHTIVVAGLGATVPAGRLSVPMGFFVVAEGPGPSFAPPVEGYSLNLAVPSLEALCNLDVDVGLAPGPFEAHDLELHARDDGYVTVSLRMARQGVSPLCGDPPLFVEPKPYVIPVNPWDIDVGPYAPLDVVEPGRTLVSMAGDGDGALALLLGRAAEGDCPAEDDVLCPPWTLAHRALDPGFEPLLVEIPSSDAFPRPWRVDEQPSLLARVGEQLVLWSRDAMGALKRFDPAPHPGFSWMGRLVAGPDSVVAGTATPRTVASQPPGEGISCEEAGACDAVVVTGRPVLVQRFGCGLGSAPPPSTEQACLEDVDCGEDQFCQREGVCVPPPECAFGGCEPFCYGACRALPAIDAGPPIDDAGSSDAGAQDGGAVDAAGVDIDAGGGVDVGGLDGGGARADAGVDTGP